MSLDLDPTEQRLAAALGRLAAAHVTDTGEPAAPPTRPDHRRWLAIAVAASLIALVAGIWAVAGRGIDPAPITVPPTPAPTPPPPTPPPSSDPAQRPRPTSIGIIAPDAAEELGLDPTAWLQDDPDAFVDDTSLLTYALRRGAAPEVLTWQLLPTYWWQTSRLGAAAVSLADGRTAFRSDDGETVTLSVLLDDGVLNATVGAADEPTLRAWLNDIDPAIDPTRLEPPTDFEVVGTTAASASVIHAGLPGDAGQGPSPTRVAFVLTVELDRDASLADVLTARHRDGAFEPVDDDPSAAYDPELQVLVWQAGPRRFVEVRGSAADPLATMAGGLVTVPSDSPLLVAGVRAFDAPGQIPAASLTRTVLAATPYGRFAYSELDDGEQTCWQISSFLGGKGDCGGSMSQRPICITSRGATGPWDAMIVVIDRDAADVVVEHEGRTVAPELATGGTPDGTRWLVGWVTGIDGAGTSFPATITVDGIPCAT